MGNNTVSEVKGIGKLKIVNPDQSTVVLTGVRYMPSMVINLISYGQLEKNGCKYSGKNYNVVFFKGGKKVLSGNYKDGLYYLDGSVEKAEVNVVRQGVNMTNLWHSRLGHMSLKNMYILVKNGYLSDKEVHTLDFCEECVLGKANKLLFPMGKHTTTEVLGYVYSDLWGYVSNAKSLSGCKYFLTLIDDFLHKVWIRFLRSKDEVYENILEWEKLVETQTGKKVKCFRTDNGLEFCDNQMEKMCKDA